MQRMVAGSNDDQLSGVLDLVERLRERPPWRRRERLRPLLFLLGPSTRRVAEAIGRSCAERRAPVSRIAARTESDDVAGVLREAKWELSRPRCHPRFEPEPRFRLLEMLLRLRELRKINLAAHQGPAESTRDHHAEETAEYRRNRQLVEKLELGGPEAKKAIRQLGRKRRQDENAGRGKFAAFLDYVDHIVPIAAAVVLLISVTAVTTLDLVVLLGEAAVGLVAIAGRILAEASGWFEGHRYRWFVNQPYISDLVATDFHDFVLDIIRFVESGAERRRRDEQLDLLLIGAFLEDLRRNYRRRRRAAWARVSYPVLIFDHLTTGHIGCRFIEMLERAREKAQAERGQPDFDPLVVVAGIDPDTPAEPGGSTGPGAPRLLDRLTHSIAAEKTADDTPANLESAATLWQRHHREQQWVDAFGPLRVLLVDVTGPQDPDFDAVRDELRPARNRPWAAHYALPWLAMFALVTPSVAWYVHRLLEGCGPPAVRQAANGECIGITDGSYHFNPRLSGIEQRIKQLNDEVAASRKPYVTVVYLGPLTADPTTSPQQDLLASAQGELFGLAIGQQEYNHSGPPLRMRILLANTGSKMQYAQQVAHQIRMHAQGDPHIVGVVGFEQSRTQTQQAIAEISKAALPMIGTANSFDHTAQKRLGSQQFGPPSQYYFRLAPPNHRLAAHAAYWARSGLTGGVPARTVTVVYDGNSADLYSKNLADDFRADFGPKNVTELSYTHPGDVPNLVAKACEDPPDIFYYVGRSDEFGAFRNQLTDRTCGNGRARIVLADDEIAKYVNDNLAGISRDDAIRLYYTPLALREAWSSQWVGQAAPKRVFFSPYDEMVREILGPNPPADTRPSPTRAAVSFDATLMFATVASQIFGEQGVQPKFAAILAALIGQEDSGASLQGASGVLGFGPRSGGHQVEDKPVLLATVRPDGKQEVLAVCGRLVPSGVQRDCPAGDR